MSTSSDKKMADIFAQLSNDPLQLNFMTLKGCSSESELVYEHTRKLLIELGHYFLELLPVCTCPDMRADEWEFLCASHHPPKDCPAISYSAHTLDAVTNAFTNPDTFPDPKSISEDLIKAKLPSMYRRLIRIFIHVYYQHEELFFVLEKKFNRLYTRFSSVAKKFKMLPDTAFIIPESYKERLL